MNNTSNNFPQEPKTPEEMELILKGIAAEIAPINQEFADKYNPLIQRTINQDNKFGVALNGSIEDLQSVLDLATKLNQKLEEFVNTIQRFLEHYTDPEFCEKQEQRIKNISGKQFLLLMLIENLPQKIRAMQSYSEN